MSEQEAIETTRLLNNQPKYVFSSSLARKRRVRQFQCCVCSFLLIGFFAALMIAVAYTINLPLDAKNNTEPQSNKSDIIPTNAFMILLENMTWPLEDKTNIRNFNHSVDLTEALRHGQIMLDEKDAIENNTPSLTINSPSFRHQKAMGTSEKARILSRKGYQLEGATHFIYRNNSTDDALSSNICFSSRSMEMCFETKYECNRFHKYRSYNGECNNLIHYSTFGVAYRPFRRALKADYADGISKPRMAKNNQNLPTARTVSLEVHRPYHRSDSKFSVMLAIWGQFLDHDITATALSQKKNGSSISCCQIGGVSSPDCFPVYLDSTDPLAEYNLTCMEFVRSASSPKCCLGAREQMNQATAFIDGSVIYGNDEDKVVSLRSMSNGLLKMYLTEDNRTLLPVSDDMNDGCNREEQKQKGRYCFASGDLRANENLHLTSMHLIWARQHNLLANKLLELNPHWNDERIFQESRRIIAAQMQHITYKEFLPILIGEKLMKKHNLEPNDKGYFQKYNETIDPSIANEFASAAFRFAHTIIPGLMKFLANDTDSPQYIQMQKMLFNPFELYQEGQLDRTLKGAMDTNIEASDTYFSNELKSHLFEENTGRNMFSGTVQGCGLDLVSLNIQRGRDHGLPGYVFWKEHCGLNKTKHFNDLNGILEPPALENIKAIYRDVEDIDLYTGAVSEKPLNGSILGPTLTCLILDQFMRLKYADRFWYETSESPQRFSLDQLDEIRKTSLARIICDNADSLKSIQPLVMKSVRRENENIPCEQIPSVDLSLWKDTLSRVTFPSQRLNVNVLN